MAKKPFLTGVDKTNIAMAFKENPLSKAEAIRQTASSLSKRDLGLSTVQRELVGLRRVYKEGRNRDDKDGPWSIGTIAKYPIRPQYIALITHYNQEWVTQKGERITIRQALWMDKLNDIPLNQYVEERLSHDVSIDSFKPEEREELGRELGNTLVRVASMYAELERWADIQEIELDTSMFDDIYLEKIWGKLRLYLEDLRKHKNKNS